jgi:hypothetical protein
MTILDCSAGHVSFYGDGDIDCSGHGDRNGLGYGSVDEDFEWTGGNSGAGIVTGSYFCMYEGSNDDYKLMGQFYGGEGFFEKEQGVNNGK